MFEDDFEILDEELGMMDDPVSGDDTSPFNNSTFTSGAVGKNNDKKNLNDKIEKTKSDNLNNKGNNEFVSNKNNVKPTNLPKSGSGIDNGNSFKKAGNVSRISGGADSNDSNAQKDALKAAGKEAIKPIVRSAVQAATGGTVGSDPVTGKIIDQAVDKAAESPNIDKVIDETVKKVKKIKNRLLIILVLVVACFLFPLVAIIAAILSPVALTAEFVGGIGGFFASLGNWLIGNGWCSSDAQCQVLYENEYYEELDNFTTRYKSVCNMDWNSELITATIFYEQMSLGKDFDVKESEDATEEDGEEIERTETDLSMYNYKNAASKVKSLTKVLYPNLNNEESSNRCDANYRDYKNHARNYVSSNYSELKKQHSVEDIVEDIMAFANELVIEQAYVGSYYCSGVTVTREDGSTMGTYDLETYVAGVVQAEGYADAVGIEALKAQAISARTFVLKYTNNCNKSIESSQKTQVFKDPVSDNAFKAASETEGLILEYDGEIMLAQYDSFYTGGDYKCDDTGCSNTYEKLPNGEKHTVTVSNKYKNWIAGGHGRGMSQIASYDLADQGYLYEEILYKFYSPGVEIAKIGGLIQGGMYSSGIAPIADKNVLKERASSDTDMFYNSSKGLVSQCPWYAKSRASEIIYYSDMPEDLKQAAIQSISNTLGNGVDIYVNADSELFLKSADYTQPRPGSLVSWESSCHIYGHVGVIEQVNEDGSVLLSDGWNAVGAGAANIWQNIDYAVRNVSLDYIKSHNSSTAGCVYSFVGYVYLLG